MKIAIVEDDINMRKSLEISMGDFKEYEIVTFKNATDALKKLDDSFDLVITDVNMPNMDGITLVEELRKISTYSKTPILVLTTERSDEMKSKGKAAGATGWIVKPFVPDQLLKAVNIVTKR